MTAIFVGRKLLLKEGTFYRGNPGLRTEGVGFSTYSLILMRLIRSTDLILGNKWSNGVLQQLLLPSETPRSNVKGREEGDSAQRMRNIVLELVIK